MAIESTFIGGVVIASVFAPVPGGADAYKRIDPENLPGCLPQIDGVSSLQYRVLLNCTWYYTVVLVGKIYITYMTYTCQVIPVFYVLHLCLHRLLPTR